MDITALLCCGHCIFACCNFYCIFLVGLVKLNVSYRSVFFLDVTGIVSDHFNRANLGSSLFINRVMLQSNQITKVTFLWE